MVDDDDDDSMAVRLYLYLYLYLAMDMVWSSFSCFVSLKFVQVRRELENYNRHLYQIECNTLTTTIAISYAKNTQCIESVKCDGNEFDFGMRMHVRQKRKWLSGTQYKSGYEFAIQTQW